MASVHILFLLFFEQDNSKSSRRILVKDFGGDWDHFIKSLKKILDGCKTFLRLERLTDILYKLYSSFFFDVFNVFSGI